MSLNKDNAQNQSENSPCVLLYISNKYLKEEKMPYELLFNGGQSLRCT